MFRRTVFWAPPSPPCPAARRCVGGGPGKPKRVLGVLSAHAQAVPRGPLAILVSQKVEDDLGVHRMHPRSVDAVLQGEGGGHSLPIGHGARDGDCPGAVEVGGEGDTGGMPAGPAPDASEDVWRQVSGIK